MKTIGTCENCEFYNTGTNIAGYCKNEKNDDDYTGEDGARPRDAECYAACITPGKDFGCVHWQDKRPPLANYPTRSRLELENEDLRSENDAAFQKIQQLSEALVALGYDPTQLP